MPSATPQAPTRRPSLRRRLLVVGAIWAAALPLLSLLEWSAARATVRRVEADLAAVQVEQARETFARLRGAKEQGVREAAALFRLVGGPPEAPGGGDHLVAHYDAARTPRFVRTPPDLAGVERSVVTTALMDLVDSMKAVAGFLRTPAGLMLVGAATTPRAEPLPAGTRTGGYLVLAEPVTDSLVRAGGVGFRQRLRLLSPDAEGPREGIRSRRVAGGDSLETRFLLAGVTGRPAAIVVSTASRALQHDLLRYSTAALAAALLGSLALLLFLWSATDRLLLRPLATMGTAFEGMGREGALSPVETGVTAAELAAVTAKFNATVESLRRAQEERSRLAARLIRSQQLERLGLLAGGVAHDFNNLLTAVRGHAELALGGRDLSEGTRRHLVQTISAARQAADLTGQMLAYSGQGLLVPGPVRLVDIVSGMTELLRIAVARHCELRSEPSDAPPVEADPTQLRQVLMNLILNASEALGGAPGVVTVRTGALEASRADLAECRINPDIPPGPYGYIEVEDTGAGMTPDVMDRIFDPFFTTKFTGRGLGLAAVQGIVRAHGGALLVRSAVGRGTRFRVLLPLATPPRPEASDGNGAPSVWRGYGTVVVADDEERVRDIAAEMLEELGFRVLRAGSGGEAVEAVRASAEPVRAVLLDLAMPGADTPDTCRRIHDSAPLVRVVLTSGYQAPDSPAARNVPGVVGFLQKPFGSEELRAAMHSALSPIPDA